MATRWNAAHYDHYLQYVGELGKGLIDLLDPRPSQRILDLGCGTGDLTAEMAQRGATVVGLDQSPAMIQRAQAKYPALTFIVARAETFRTAEPFDAVFSNAALHWMPDATAVAQTLWQVLKPHGRLVAELGAQGNVQTVISAIERALTESGISPRGKNPWYFPTIGEYTSLLESQGFHTLFASHFERPTVLADGARGLDHWLDGFAASYLDGLSLEVRARVVTRVRELCRPQLFFKGQWHIDYQRLRVVAQKP
jgi:trans-aconitate methyltransferase